MHSRNQLYSTMGGGIVIVDYNSIQHEHMQKNSLQSKLDKQVINK